MSEANDGIADFRQFYLFDAIQWGKHCRRIFAEYISRWKSNRNVVILISEDTRNDELAFIEYNADMVIQFDTFFHNNSEADEPFHTMKIIKYRSKKITGKEFIIKYTGNFNTPIEYEYLDGSKISRLRDNYYSIRK